MNNLHRLAGIAFRVALESAATAMVTIALLMVATGANALPTGGQVAAGQAAISTPSATQMNIKQGTNQAIINWNSFGIGRGEAVNIAQPTSQSTLLNRVLGNDPSSIYGSLTANGRVFLVNPSGVLFAPGASVNVGGLVASSLNIKDSDFLAGKYSFFKDGAAGSVVNQGTISGGFVALLGNSVENAGTIVTTKGTTGLAAGDEITLGFDPNGLMAIKVDKAAYQAQVTNSGVIEADGGTVVMSAGAADALLATVVNNSGKIRAGSMVERNGEIVIEANTVTNSGTLDVSGVKGGTITLSGDHMTLASGSLLNASGATGGGTVLVGGGWQGGGDTYQATSVTMEKGAKIDVSATKVGDGGTAVLWSDVRKDGSVTKVDGEILAKGGIEGGDGGKVETSGHALKIGDSARVSTQSTSGNSGNWLLDPTDFTIAATGGDITGTALTTALASNNITITTNPANCFITGGATACTGYSQISTGATGDINVNQAVTWSSTKELFLDAYRRININAPISVTGAGTLYLKYGADYSVSAPDNSANPYGYYLSPGIAINLAATSIFKVKTPDPYEYVPQTYTILTTAAELIALGNSTTQAAIDKNFVLGNDIDLASAAFLPIGGSTVNGQYGYTFAGLGHKIKNLSINLSTIVGTTHDRNSAVGFFAQLSSNGKIRDVGLVGGSVVGETTATGNLWSLTAGSLVGLSQGKIFNSYSNVSVQSGRVAGGLVGWVYSGSVDQSYATGAVSTVHSTRTVNGYISGGLAGATSDAVISKSYAAGTVTGFFDNVELNRCAVI